MIFATVGSQMPFDRLVQALDEWAGSHLAHPVFAQIGDSVLRPVHLTSCRSLTPQEFRDRVLAADVVVAHAGMGSVLTALEFNKPLVLLPRRGDLRETRNDHQVATARWLSGKQGIEVAMEPADLPAALQRALQRNAEHRDPQARPSAQGLVNYLSNYLDQVASGQGPPRKR